MTGTIDDRLLHRVHAEFSEMPGLRLTARQAERLWSLDEATCAGLLDALIDAGFLTRMPDGRYARVGDSEVIGKRIMARAPALAPRRRAS